MRKFKFIMAVATFSLLAAVVTGCPSDGDTGGSGGDGYTPSPPPPSSSPAEFEVLSLNIPSGPMAGNEITISVEVGNVGELSGNYTAVLKVDGQEVGTQQVNISGGQSQTVPFSVTMEQAGSYTVTIGNLTQAMEVLAMPWTADGVISVNEYESITILADGGFELHWKSDGEYIYIAMKSQGSGYLSVGFIGGQAVAEEADLILGFDIDGQTTLLDMFSTLHPATPMHGADTSFGGSDNIIEFGGREDSNHTIIEFKRLLDTGDPFDYILTPGINNIMWAYGNNDNATSGHIQRGFGQIEI